jgi:hypothetical protein
MTNRNFKNSGLRILEAPNGDLCITDKGGREWWVGRGDALFLNAGEMQQAKFDERKAALFFRRFFDFITAHRQRRSQWHDVPETTAQEGARETKGGSQEA